MSTPVPLESQRRFPQRRHDTKEYVTRAASLIVVALAIGLLGCGGEDQPGPAEKRQAEKPATRTSAAEEAATPARSPDDKRALQRAALEYNKGYDAFYKSFVRSTKVGDFNAVKADIAELRTVLFVLDKRIRDITFDDSRVIEVNSILENNRELIAKLDTVEEAQGFGEARKILKEFVELRTKQVRAVNSLIGTL